MSPPESYAETESRILLEEVARELDAWRSVPVLKGWKCFHPFSRWGGRP